MYSTCTFCHAPLGANELIEHFPVGRRLAFDAARGRLWVVCAACRQWNLSPLEERWEAIEEAERLYRDTRLRVTTDHVGLARLRDGSELVRIGEPQRPEFAAWRYGGRFEARWRRSAASAAIVTTGIAGLVIAGPLTGLIAGSAIGLPLQLASAAHNRFEARRFRRVVARFDDADGPIVVTDGHFREARLVTAPEDQQGWRLRVPHARSDLAMGVVAPADIESKPIVLSGEDAVRAVRAALPRINRKGGRRRTVQEAVQVLEQTGSMHDAFRHASTQRGRDYGGDPSRDLFDLPAPLRLALEMAAHEELERRALEGELAALEQAWREAEEIAAIADTLTLPERVVEQFKRLRR